MSTLFPDGSGLFQQDNAPCHTAHIVQEWFEEYDEEFKVLPWDPNSQNLNPIEHLWDVPASLIGGGSNSQPTWLEGSAEYRLGARYHSLGGSVLFWQYTLYVMQSWPNG